MNLSLFPSFAVLLVAAALAACGGGGGGDAGGGLQLASAGVEQDMVEAAVAAADAVDQRAVNLAGAFTDRLAEAGYPDPDAPVEVQP